MNVPIIDTHIHLFDPQRPEGIPWPEKEDGNLYQPALPDRYEHVTRALGIRGAIVVEASPWLEDNEWILHLAADNEVIVGTVGNLDPGHADFARHLERFQRNPLFLGIRCGNLWNRDMGSDLSRSEFISGLKSLADAGLELDTFNSEPAIAPQVLRLTDKVPNLRIVINHLAQVDPPRDARSCAMYEADLRELSHRPQVYAKVSAVLRRVNGEVSTELNHYKPRLEMLWDVFGEDRLLYASDWPNSDLWAPYSVLLSLVSEYFVAKGQTTAEKFFWKNSVSAYHWIRRNAGQPASSSPTPTPIPSA